MAEDEAAADRQADSLTGLPQQGGLLIRKDRPRHNFEGGGSDAGGSRLGLDRLAAEKARAREAMLPPPGGAISEIKRPRLSHLHEQDGDGVGTSRPGDERHYRRPKPPTPSHGGGVNREVAAQIASRVKERLKGDGQVFTTRSEAGGLQRVCGGAQASSFLTLSKTSLRIMR